MNDIYSLFSYYFFPPHNNVTRTKTSIRYAKENDREKRERKKGRKRDIKREGEIRDIERKREVKGIEG